MPLAPPPVAVGLPVYNGEAFLADALDSLLDQTYADFELIVADNASTDGTEAIARGAAARDARVRYVRHATNIGGLANFNAAFALSRSPYFRWAAHDDLVAPTFLARCVPALDAEPGAALAFTQQRVVDEAGRAVPFDAARGGYLRHDGGLFDYDLPTETALVSDDPADRFLAALRSTHASGPAIHGLFRAEALRQTRLFRFHGSDRLLLAEAALAGPFRQVAEPLFVRRVLSVTPRSRRDWAKLESGARPEGMLVPPFRSFANYWRAVERSSLTPAQKARCYAGIAAHAVRLRSLRDLVVPGAENYWGLERLPWRPASPTAP